MSTTKTEITTDQTIQLLFEKVQKKKDEISKAERPNWVTNCMFRYGKENIGDAINIQVQTDPEVLINTLAFLLEKSKTYKEAAEILQLTKTKFSWGGYSVEDWITDFKTRLNKIQVAAKKQELKTLEERLDNIVSPEMKRQLEIAAIAKLLEE